jgi:AraC-like DNA-binding protein
VDELAGLLDGPRARGAFLLRALLEPPWSLRIEDRAPLSVTAMIRGEAWVVPSAGSTARLGAGDVAIMRGPEPYLVADDPATPPQAVIHPGQRCTTVDGRDLHDEMTLGVRTWGNSPDGSTRMLVGTYQMSGEVSQRLLAALPELAVLDHGICDSPVLALLDDEIDKDRPGQEVVLDRLLDLLLVGVLRAWFSRPDADAPAWYRAHGDPVVGTALRLLHQRPEHPWTVASLAEAAGASRAALARRFTERLGEPPMAYLTGWRLALAADLLRDTDETIGTIARKVGYGSPFALSSAFKRVRGIRPDQHRRGRLAS